MSTPARLASRRHCLKVLGRALAAPAVLSLSGCGDDPPKPAAESGPVVPLKPVPKKKGVGKNELEPPFDPREKLKNKGAGG